MESDLPKGYRAAAEPSSEVAVPEQAMWVSRDTRPDNNSRGAAERSSKVGVPVVPEFVGCRTNKQGGRPGVSPERSPRKMAIPELLGNRLMRARPLSH